MQLKFRTLDQSKDWMFFHETHSLASEHRIKLQPLEDSSARMVWAEFVSANPRERHPMLLPAGHWIGNVTAMGPDWHAVWNAPDLSDSVADFLRSRVPWPATTEALFFWSRENAVQVQWGMFLHAWKTFLYDDEGPYLKCLQRPEFVCFGPTGGMGVGLRTGPLHLSAAD